MTRATLAIRYVSFAIIAVAVNLFIVRRALGGGNLGWGIAALGT